MTSLELSTIDMQIYTSRGNIMYTSISVGCFPQIQEKHPANFAIDFPLSKKKHIQLKILTNLRAFDCNFLANCTWKDRLVVEVQSVWKLFEYTPEVCKAWGNPKDGRWMVKMMSFFSNLGGFLRFQPLIESGVNCQYKLGLKIQKGQSVWNLQRVLFFFFQGKVAR